MKALISLKKSKKNRKSQEKSFKLAVTKMTKRIMILGGVSILNIRITR